MLGGSTQGWWSKVIYSLLACFSRCSSSPLDRRVILYSATVLALTHVETRMPETDVKCCCECSLNLDLALQTRFGLVGAVRLKLRLIRLFQLGLKLLENPYRSFGLLGDWLHKIQMATGRHPFPSLGPNLNLICGLAPLDYRCRYGIGRDDFRSFF